MSIMRKCVKDKANRYLLAESFVDNPANPLMVIGANPSIADAEKTDLTFGSICRIARGNGYDQVIVVNLTPFIAANPQNLPYKQDVSSASRNHKIIEEAANHIVNMVGCLDVWCAWGNLVETRTYLPLNRTSIIKLLINRQANLLSLPNLTKNGNPAHPLYHKHNSRLVPYQI